MCAVCFVFVVMSLFLFQLCLVNMSPMRLRRGRRMIREIVPLFLLSLTPGRLSRFVDFDVFSEGPDGDPEAFSEVFERSETDFASLLAFWRNREEFPEVSEESECVRMFRGLPKTVDLEGDDLDMDEGNLEEYTPTEPDPRGPRCRLQKQKRSPSRRLAKNL